MNPVRTPAYTADIDVGGTFTDGFFTGGGQAHRAKALTTPHDLTECFLACLSRGAAAFDEPVESFLARAQVVRLSTTLGTNTLLQHRGPKVGLLVTAGEEGTWYSGGPATGLGMLVPESLVRGIDEGIDGDAPRPPETEQVLQAVRELLDAGARLIAVSLRGGWRDPSHEERVREIVTERYPTHYLRSVPLQLAGEVSAAADDHIRTNTVAVNAYLHRDLSRGLYRAEDLARERGMRHPLLVVHAAGGSARVAKTVAVQTLGSGPAVAVQGAAVAARRLGYQQVVTADMGGTSLDIAILGKADPPVAERGAIGGVKIAVPMLSTESIGSGGGSLARLEGGEIVVGPESAGSAPGPACYGKGGLHPTVTDANLLLGLLHPERFLGGRMRLDIEKAQAAIHRRLCRELGSDAYDAAAGIRGEVARAIAASIGERITAAGGDPADYTLFAIGGSGPLHGCGIAERAGIPRVVGFPFGSVFSAYGSSTVDVWHRYTRTVVGSPERDELLREVGAALDALYRQGQLDMRGEGFAPKEVQFATDLVIEGQDGSRRIEIDETTIAAAASLIGRGEEPREVVVEVRAATPVWAPERRDTPPSHPEPGESRQVRWGAHCEAAPMPIHDLASLVPGAIIVGPALLEASDTVFAVNPGWSAHIDGYGDVVAEHTGKESE